MIDDMAPTTGELLVTDEVKIKAAGNGYTIEMRDPDIERQNAKPDMPYRNPYVEFVFTEKEDLFSFLDKVLDKLTKGDEYDTAFSRALTEEATDD